MQAGVFGYQQRLGLASASRAADAHRGDRIAAKRNCIVEEQPGGARRRDRLPRVSAVIRHHQCCPFGIRVRGGDDCHACTPLEADMPVAPRPHQHEATVPRAPIQAGSAAVLALTGDARIHVIAIGDSDGPHGANSKRVEPPCRLPIDAPDDHRVARCRGASHRLVAVSKDSQRAGSQVGLGDMRLIERHVQCARVRGRVEGKHDSALQSHVVAGRFAREMDADVSAVGGNANHTAKTAHASEPMDEYRAWVDAGCLHSPGRGVSIQPANFFPGCSAHSAHAATVVADGDRQVPVSLATQEEQFPPMTCALARR